MGLTGHLAKMYDPLTLRESVLPNIAHCDYNAAMLWKLDGYLAIPHELMHVVAYRMIGKRCAYQLGEHAVPTFEDRTLPQRLF